MPVLLEAQGDVVLDYANDTNVFTKSEGSSLQPPGCMALPRLCWRRKGAENSTVFIIQERNRTKPERCSVTKRGCLLSGLGQWLIETCQKYHKEKYRVITVSIAPRILRQQNIFNDCFYLVESIIS